MNEGELRMIDTAGEGFGCVQVHVDNMQDVSVRTVIGLVIRDAHRTAIGAREIDGIAVASCEIINPSCAADLANWRGRIRMLISTIAASLPMTAAVTAIFGSILQCRRR